MVYNEIYKRLCVKELIKNAASYGKRIHMVKILLTLNCLLDQYLTIQHLYYVINLGNYFTDIIILIAAYLPCKGIG